MRSSFLGLALTVVAAGCSSPTAAAHQPPADQEIETGVSSKMEPLLRPGEWVAGTVYIVGIEAAQAEAWVCRDEADQIRVHLYAQSTGLLALLRQAYMEQDTVLGPELNAPLRNWADAQVGEKQRRYDVRFGVGFYDYEYHRSYGEPRRKRIRVARGERAQDLLSAFLLLRGWRPGWQAQAQFGAVIGRWLWRTDVTFHGPDVVVREEGPYPAVRVDGFTRKQHPDPESQEEYNFQLWFSDDPSRIPLRARTGSSFGDMWLELRDYRDDYPERCREHQRIFELPQEGAD